MFCVSSDEFPTSHIVFTVIASQHVEIDNNEFFGWRGAGVDVQDPIVRGDPPGTPGRINRANADTVSVHDNYMHDNQHPTTCSPPPVSGHGLGYGISMSNGAYVNIERNVFDRNRHAIAGHGSPGDGYLAFDNLFMHPGIDSVRFGIPQYNHQIDMHGLKSCGIIGGESSNCGDAGEFMDVGWNTVVFGGSDAIQLRGEPTSEEGMSVHNNVFAQDRSHALTQTVIGLIDNGGNVFGQAGPLGDKFAAGAGDPGGGVCDFDRDGVQDAFRTTGVTWWYFSSLLGRWIWLRESPLTANNTLHDINGDGRCDVPTSAGVFFTPSSAGFDVTQPGNQVGTIGQPVNLPLVQVGAGSLAWRAFGLPPGLWIDAGTGRFGGTPTQDGSYLVQFRARDGRDDIVQGYFQWTIGPNTPAPIRVPFVIGTSVSQASGALRSAGLGTPTQHNVVDANCNEAVGTVLDQIPSAGTLEPPGFAVHLEVEAWPGGGRSCN